MSHIYITPSFLFLALFATLCSTTACGAKKTDCADLCFRMLTCEMTFTAPDDAENLKIKSGERTEAESCQLGCKEHKKNNADSVDCINQLALGHIEQCQNSIQQCLDL